MKPVQLFGMVRMAGRRVLFAVLVAFCTLGALGLMAAALSPGGWSSLDLLALAAFAVVLPWLSVGFCNGVIGLALEWFSRNPLRAVNPMAAGADLNAPLVTSTAILLCVRNESAQRLVRNLQLLAQGLMANADAREFHVYVLSDTTDSQMAEQEAQAFEALARQWQPSLALTYRRREQNTGYKAGNIQDFCAQWGNRHELAVVLDADSLMCASAVRRLVLMMQSNPQIGILQGLVVGLPAASAFTRLFQFGMRLGMRSYTLGSAWWQGDCGPFWGHNAVIRIAPFAKYCQLPVLGDRRGREQHILSHDQVEAVLMRRAGFEVRVYPIEDQSFEENPPNLLDFVARDLRWCAGNMQYARLVGLPGLALVSRLQLLLAILMFAGAPAWLALFAVLGWSVHQSSWSQVFDMPMLATVFGVLVAMISLPRLASALVVLCRADARRSFGGGTRFTLGFLFEQVFSVLVTPVMWVSQTILLLGLPFGRRISWGTQNRDAQQVAWFTATRALGVHTLLGIALGWLWIDLQTPATWAIAYFLAGLWLAVPFAVISSWPRLGQFFQRFRLAGVPEEFTHSQVLSERCELEQCPSQSPGQQPSQQPNASAPVAPSFEAGR